MPLFGMSMPRKSKRYLAYVKAMKEGGQEGAAKYLDTLSFEEVQKLAEEVAALAADKIDQEIARQFRDEQEKRSFPLGFSID